MLLSRLCSRSLRSCGIFTSTASYRKPLPGKSDIWDEKEDKFKKGDWFQEEENLGQVQDWLGSLDRNLLKEIVSEEEKRAKTLKFKIIERKYFKKPQETNLLTWDAKEQLRFLHREHPEEWTVDRLAESFPISRDGVIKLLRSKHYLRTPHEVKAHDEKVKKHWLALKEGSKKAGGPIMLKYKQLLGEGKMAAMINASGMKSLPMPEKQYLNPGRSDKQPEVGKFLSIVKNYNDALKVKELSNCPEEHKGETDEENTQKLLETIAFSGQTGIEKQHEKQKTRNNKRRMESSYPQVDVDILHDNSENVSYGRDQKKISGTMLDASVEHSAGWTEDRLSMRVFQEKRDVAHARDNSLCSLTRDKKADMEKELHAEDLYVIEGRGFVEDQTDWTSKDDNQSINVSSRNQSDRKAPRVRTLRRLRGSKRTIKLGIDDYEKYQMEGTGKIDTKSENSMSSEDKNTRNHVHVNSSSFVHPDTHLRRSVEKMEILAQMQYDTRREVISDSPEAYFYDMETGYQRPFGKVESSEERISVPENTGNKPKVYRKGKAYYDEDGELLYKVP